MLYYIILYNIIWGVTEADGSEDREDEVEARHLHRRGSAS
jgi:hypothetical protein